MFKYLNSITFVLEKLASVTFFSIAIYRSVPIYEYTQLVYFSTLFIAFFHASIALYTAKLQAIYLIKKNKVNELGFVNSCREFLKNGFHSELGRAFLVMVIALPCLLLGIVSTDFFGLQKIQSSFAFHAFVTFLVGEFLFQVTLQHLRFGCSTKTTYYFRLVGLTLKAISLVLGICFEDLVFALLINGILLLSTLAYLFYGAVSLKRLVNLARKLNVLAFVKNAFCLGVIGSCATFISGFDRVIVPRLISNSDKLEVFAQLKFYQGFLGLMVPFVGFWLAPLATAQISSRGLSSSLFTLINSLNFYFFVGGFCTIYIFYQYINSESFGFSIAELAIFSFSCSAVLIFNFLSLVFFNSHPVAVSTVTGLLAAVILSIISIFPSIHSITVASYSLVFGSIMLIVVLRASSAMLFKPLIGVQFVSTVLHTYVIYFGVSLNFTIIAALCLIFLCVFLEGALRFRNFRMIVFGGKS